MSEPLNPHHLSPHNLFLLRAGEGKRGLLSDCSTRSIGSISDEMLEVGNFTEKGNGLRENKRMGWGRQEKGEEILSFFLTLSSPD